MKDYLTQLRETGLAIFEPLNRWQVAALNSHLFNCQVYYDAHVPQTARNLGRGSVSRRDPRAEASECVCVHPDHVATAPWLLERAYVLTDLVGAYLGRDPPLLYSLNAFWTRPGKAPERKDIQAFHEDKDDERFVAMFVYLSHVHCDEDGPHDLYGPDGVCRPVFGPAGTVFLADTSRNHRGRKPTTAERGIAWARWGVSDPPAAYVWDKTAPTDARLLGDRYPADPRLRESIRLVVS